MIARRDGARTSDLIFPISEARIDQIDISSHYTQAAGERELGNHALVSLELCTLPIRLRANLQLPLRIPQISVRSLGVIYPIAIGYWESCWPDAMFDTRFLR